MEPTPTPWYSQPWVIALFPVAATALLGLLIAGTRRMIGYYSARLVSHSAPTFSATITKTYELRSGTHLVLSVEASGLNITTVQPNGFRRAEAEIKVNGRRLILRGNQIKYESGRIILGSWSVSTSDVDTSLWVARGQPLKYAKVTMRIWVNSRKETLKGRISSVKCDIIDETATGRTILTESF
jgi:hypothetical protein